MKICSISREVQPIMIDTMGKRIKKARLEKGLKQEDLAHLMDVTRSAVGNWEHNRSAPPAKNFPRLASILGVSASYLQMATDYPYLNEIDLPEGIKKISIIDTVKCGTDGLLIQEDGGYISVEKRRGEELRAFRFKGDSMVNDGIFDGDIAIARIQDSVQSGELAIVIVGGEEGTLKRVQYQNDAIILEAANPSYPARVFIGMDKAIVHIIGKVIETRRKW